MTGFDETAGQSPPPEANAFPADDPTTPRPDDEQPPPPRTAAEVEGDADEVAEDAAVPLDAPGRDGS